MAKETPIVPRAENLVLPDEELFVLAEIAANEKYMVVLKRVARAYADNMSKLAFRISPEDPNLAIKHTRYYEQAMGMQILVNLITQSLKKIDEKER